jgi:hypothetical protein
MRIIGAANEFWRVRLTRVDTTNDFDFEWHDDILYREPRTAPIDEVERWTVEALRLDDRETVVTVAEFSTRAAAERFLTKANEDVAMMTKSQFEAAYLSARPHHDEPVEGERPE